MAKKKASNTRSANFEECGVQNVRRNDKKCSHDTEFELFLKPSAN